MDRRAARAELMVTNGRGGVLPPHVPAGLVRHYGFRNDVALRTDPWDWIERLDALLRDNVTLEDEAIERILPHAIRTKSGKEYPVDLTACATGFDVAKMLGSLEVVGRGGRSLGDEWGADDPRAYLGMTIPGYPNFFMTVGPNSAPNHAAGQNLVSETQVNFIVECLDLIVANGKKSIEVKQEAFDDWNRKVDDRMPEMIWTHPKANSYYNNSKGRVYLSFPFRLVDFWTWTRKPEADHFILR